MSDTDRLNLAELRRIAEEMSKAPIGAERTSLGRQSFTFYGMNLDGMYADEVAAELPEKILSLLDRIEALEAEYQRIAGDGGLLANALRDNKNLAATAAHMEARLARVTDDSMAERLAHLFDAKWEGGTSPGSRHYWMAGDVLATIRAVAADEQDAPDA